MTDITPPSNGGQPADPRPEGDAHRHPPGDTTPAPGVEHPTRGRRPSDPDGGPPSIPEERVTLGNLPWAITTESEERSLPPWFRRAVVLVLTLAVVSRILIWGFGELTSFWFTLFVSFFAGLTLEPIVNYLAARGVRRGLATILVMACLAGAAIAFFLVFGSLLADQLAQLIRSIPGILEQIVSWANERFGTTFEVGEILGALGIGTDDLAKAAANLGVGLFSVISTAVGLLFSMFTIALFSFYFAADGPNFRRTIASWLPPRQQRTFLTVWEIATQKAGGYVISRGILAVISTAFHGVVFLLLDLPYWLPLAMWVGVVSQFVPTIGTYLAGALPIIIALVEGSPGKALAVLAAVTAYQQVENYFVAPRVTRSTLEIHPAIAFGSVIVGSTLFGATGALLAIPVVATIQALFSVYGRRYDLVTELGAKPGASVKWPDRAAVQAADEGVTTER